VNWRELAGHAEALGFTPQDAVRWLSPRELARAGVKVVVSQVFADFADKRELQGSLPVEPIVLPDPDALGPGHAQPVPTAAHRDGDVWIDFTADTGDGFDATYTVASLLGADEVAVEVDGREQRLPRGSLLVLGGDEVYPSASARNYEDRMLGPFEAALPRDRVAADDRPLLVALPGNHDWYDGLTAFLRIFTHRRSIGGWLTAQSRSYFAVQLPHRWWLLGLDSQFGTYIDEPQLSYFERTVSSQLQPGDGIILCSATPTWVKSVHDPTAFDSLIWFDQHYLRNRPVGVDTYEPTGASVRLWLTGDSHHYARFAERFAGEPEDLPPEPDPRRRQLITCGLGGAYLSATHHLEPRLELPSTGSRVREREPSAGYAVSDKVWPGRDDSRRMSRRLAQPWRPEWLPLRNPGMGELFAGIHAFGFLVLLSVYAQAGRSTHVGVLRRSDAFDGAQFALHTLVVGAVVGGLVLGTWWWRSRGVRRPDPTTGVLLAQVGLMLVLLLLAMVVPWGSALPGFVVLLLATLLVSVVGGAVGPALLAVQVVLARSGAPVGWQMSGQSVEDGKGFLRIRMGADGEVTVFPLVVRESVHDWELEQLPGGRARPVAAQPSRVELIEDPVRIARRAAPAVPATGPTVGGVERAP